MMGDSSGATPSTDKQHTVLIYYVIFLVAMWFPPEKLQRPFQVACASFALVVFGLLIWSVHNAGGGGAYFAKDYTPGTAYGGSGMCHEATTTRTLLIPLLGWSLAYGATAVLGNGGVVAMSLSDWSRFAKNGPKGPMSVMAIACPVFIYLACESNPSFVGSCGAHTVYHADALGIIITSASETVLGGTYWQPYLLLRYIQAHYNNSASSRAAV